MSPLYVPCPTCGAEANEYCKDTLTGVHRMNFHPTRTR